MAKTIKENCNMDRGLTAAGPAKELAIQLPNQQRGKHMFERFG